MKLIHALTLACVFLTPVSAMAAGRSLHITERGAAGPVGDRQMQQLNEHTPPVMEPKIDAVQFLKIEEPRSLKERVDTLLYGVYTDIPPEYDHFGYELRRYMAHIAGPEVLGDPIRLRAELANVKKAQIIFDYWRKDLITKIKAIEATIEADPSVSSSIRTTFKYNSGVVNAFLTECKSWLDNNEAVLKFLVNASEAEVYTYEDPLITFDTREDKNAFMSLFRAQQQSVKNINEYAPFMQMVY